MKSSLVYIAENEGYLKTLPGMVGVVAIDISVFPRLDFCNPVIQHFLLRWIRSKCIFGAWLATPCAAWSGAGHGPVNSSGVSFRDSQHLFGLPGLRINGRLKVKLENATARFTVLF